MKKNNGKSVVLFLITAFLQQCQLRCLRIYKYICNKGSIGINGISLTISNIEENKYFETVIIRHTLDKTNLKYLKIGSVVNIVTDILAKYVENMLNLNKQESKLSYNKLCEYGFI